LRPSLTRVSSSSFTVRVSQSHRFVSMVRCKNAGGAPSDGDKSPPRLTEVARGKHRKIATKKRKRTLTEAEISQAVANAANLAESSGRGSRIHIGERRFHLEGR
jgi:hypothetical protein